MRIYNGTWYPQRVLRTLIRDPEIIQVRLDPAKRELRALLDNLTYLSQDSMQVYEGKAGKERDSRQRA